MKATIIENIEVTIDLESMCKMMRLKKGSSNEKRLREIISEALDIARPRALCGQAYIDEKREQSVAIDGIEFTSRVLRVNLESCERVFPFIATCGSELEEWSCTFSDMLEQYWADTIKAIAMGAGMNAVNNHVRDKWIPGKVSSICPGSLEDWPITQQKELFSLFGDTEKLIGVTLTESCLMLPVKSLSGIIFPSDDDFTTCRLCDRERCPGRRAPFDSELRKKKFSL